MREPRRGSESLVTSSAADVTLRPLLDVEPGHLGERSGRVRPYAVCVRHDRTAPPGWKAGIVLDVLVPVLIGAAILAFVILIFAASSTRSYS